MTSGERVDRTLRAIIAADREPSGFSNRSGSTLVHERLTSFYGYFALLDVLAAAGNRLRHFPLEARPLARLLVCAVGCVAYILLTGRPPFEGTNIVEICGAHVHVAPKPPSVYAELDPELDAVVLRCLDKNPSHRPTARELEGLLA